MSVRYWKENSVSSNAKTRRRKDAKDFFKRSIVNVIKIPLRLCVFVFKLLPSCSTCEKDNHREGIW